MWSVDVELIEVWLTELDEESREQVIAALELFEDIGLHLGRPIVDTVRASRHKNMKS